MRVSFRWAEPDDSGLLLRFIQELADYENLLNEVVATEEILRKQIFKEKNAYVVFLMEDKKANDFYLSFGAKRMEDWTVQRLKKNSI